MKRHLTALITSVFLTFSAVIAGAAPASAADCGTTFNPPAPDGGPMMQTYRNCDPHFTPHVAPFYRTPSRTVVYLNNCTTVEAQKEITWQFSTTIAGAEYGTAACHNGLLIIDKRITDREAFMGCKTSLWFYGPLMEQMYPNCKTVGQDVAVGSTIDGQLLAPSNSRVWLNPDEAAVWLIHYQVEATYETVFVHGTTLPIVSPQP